MEREKIIFLRNLFLRMFVVGIVIALLLLARRWFSGMSLPAG